MHLAKPQLLYLYWLIPVLLSILGWSFYQRRKCLERFAGRRLTDELIRGASFSKKVIKAILLTVFFLLSILALARPQWGTRLETVKRMGIDLVVVLDTSLSMDTQDVVPGRLEKAKHEVRALIDGLEGDRVGLVVFAGNAMVNCPLTIDQNAVKLFLEILDTQMIPRPGTNISDAIEKATRAFDPKERRHKVMLLLTDGENLEGDPLKAAEQARDEGAVIFTIGVGTPAGEPIPLRDEHGNVTGYKKDEDGSVVVSRLDEESLQQIAKVTGGQYFRATPGENEVEKIIQTVTQMDKKEFQSKMYLTYVDRFQIPLGCALGVILLEALISTWSRPGGLWERFFGGTLRLHRLTKKGISEARKV
ncbi:MAG: VWA domain-containing protein [Terriglobia bacterium]